MMGDFDPDIRSDLVDSWCKRIENQLLAGGNILIDVKTSRITHFSHGGKYAIMWEEIMVCWLSRAFEAFEALFLHLCDCVPFILPLMSALLC
jgi:hypothetical protein